MFWRKLAYSSQEAADVTPASLPDEGNNDASKTMQISAAIPSSIGLKVYRILTCLSKVPLHQPIDSARILKETGIDLTLDEDVAERVRNNPKVSLVGENYAYQAKYNIKNCTQLLKMLDRVTDGILKDDIIDCYVGIDQDLQELTRKGEIICIRNPEKSSDVFFPRGLKFLTKLSSKVIPPSNGNICKTLKDITHEIRRGDAIQVGEDWYRVSSEVKSSSANPPISMAGMVSKSVSSIRDLETSRKIRYKYKFDEESLPLDNDFKSKNQGHNRISVMSPTDDSTVNVIKHGCTNDVRKLWRRTLQQWPTDRIAFERELVRGGLTTQKTLDASRPQKKPRMNSRRGKNKKRAQRSIKISNQHLLGTELGNLLAKGDDQTFSLGAVKYEKE